MKGEFKGQQVAVKIIPKKKNFIIATNDNDARLKAIDFGLSDFVCPEKKLDDIVGSAYYVAPEVLQRSYSTEADALSKTLIFDELVYLKEQFSLLEPSVNGFISVENLKTPLMKYTTEAMKESGVHEFLENWARPSNPVRDVMVDWIRQSDGHLTYIGFVKVLHGMTSRNLAKSQ
ncbi:putative CDPK-related protein kinase CAMK-CDPK family [Helianthus annuus]|nr:putative CDPK-related protein kinase CAMK-CDPK family [Helianthus annuus]